MEVLLKTTSNNWAAVKIMQLVNLHYSGSALQAVAYQFDMTPVEPNEWEPPGDHEGMLQDIFELALEQDFS